MVKVTSRDTTALVTEYFVKIFFIDILGHSRLMICSNFIYIRAYLLKHLFFTGESEENYSYLRRGWRTDPSLCRPSFLKQ